MNYLKAGVARADITPPLGTRLIGYPRERPADNVLDPLTVTALALTSGDTKSLILSMSLTVMDDEITSLVRKTVSEATGYGFYDINVFTWQIHSGPSTQTCWGYGIPNWPFINDIMLPGCVKAAKEAIADIGDVEIGVATTDCHIGINRRRIEEDGSVQLGQNPWAPYDPTMTVVRFVRDGKPYANIVHYGAHPTVIGPTLDITRDWPGIMVDRVENLCGGVTMFFNGAVGDVGPRTSDGRTTESGVEGMREVGFRAAYDAVIACKSIKQYQPEELEVICEDIKIPYAPLASREVAEAEFKKAEAERDGTGAGIKESNYQYWKHVLAEHEKGEILTAKTFRQIITKIGNVAIVPFPGEPFAEIVLRLRKHSPIQNTLSISTANGSVGYIVTCDAYARRGYEVNVCKAFSPYLLHERVDDALVTENLRLLRKLKV